MFEKEAEKWTIDYVCKDCSRYKECKSKEHCTCKDCSKEKWQNGAEFGYNKANEWHYVKDELPPVKKEYNNRSELVLVLSKEKEMQYAQYVEKEKTWARGICEINFEPYAWKEIVPPKERV